LSEQAPQAGSDLVLTIDIDVQQAARRAGRTARPVRGGKEDGNSHATKAPARRGGHDRPSNGNVIAMASFPTYDPRSCQRHLERPLRRAEGQR
jgi:cell division protein FtsI/penicillin-binding protein 2